jgi:hypothetical protein
MIAVINCGLAVFNGKSKLLTAHSRLLAVNLQSLTAIQEFLAALA